MLDATAFSPDYLASRARFRAAALAAGWRLHAWPLAAIGPDNAPLTIDVAVLGATEPRRAVLVSSGMHGVEGFLGGAVQAALLEDVLGGYQPPPDGALILLHALNPFGMAYLRRVNEDNADLNRNFLLPGEAYSGSPEGYRALDGLLNPAKPPGRFTAFRLRAVPKIVQHGMAALKQAVAGGQYDFPLGVFYGGPGPSETQRLLDAHLPELIGAAQRVVMIDVHSGLGKPATYKLLCDHAAGSPGFQALADQFGAAYVEPWEPTQGVSYQIRGGLGTWAKARFPHTDFDVLAAEFGTVGILDVIEALHLENRAHHWGDASQASYGAAKQRLKDTFAPTDRAWRDVVVQRGAAIVQQAIDAVLA